MCRAACRRTSASSLRGGSSALSVHRPFAALCAAHAAFRLAHGDFSCPRAVFSGSRFQSALPFCAAVCASVGTAVCVAVSAAFALGGLPRRLGAGFSAVCSSGLFAAARFFAGFSAARFGTLSSFPRLRRLFCRIRRLAFLFRGSLWFCGRGTGRTSCVAVRFSCWLIRTFLLKKYLKNARRRKKQKCRLPKKRALQSSGNAATRNSKQIFLYYL